VKKILFLTNKLPFPKTDGRKNILMQYIEAIKEIDPDISILNASFIDDEKYLSSIPKEIDKVLPLERPGIIEKAKNVLLHSLLLRKWPLQVSVFYSKSTHQQLLDFITTENPDFIIYDMVRVAEYLPVHKRVHLVLNYDDLLSLRYKRQQSYIEYIPSIFGGFTEKLPKSARKIFNTKKLQKTILNFESKLLQKYENKVAKKFHHLVFTSPKEAAEFAQEINHSSCTGIPMSFEVKNDITRKNNYNPHKLLFVGKMDIAHNVAAVLYFCENIWPIVKQKKPELEFWIAGKDPTKEVLQLQDRFDGVKVLGPVDDIKKEIITSAVFVAPLVFGTGIKTKVIEALSLGVPVVSTSIGAEGIKYTNGINMYVADDIHQFADYIIELVNHPERNRQLARNGKKMVQEDYSKDNMKQKWQRILANVH
jgi:glycosyltransferase involved in cell wall biosynthesis